MDAQDLITCFLCHELTAKRKHNIVPDWEKIWLKKCSESLAKLLDLEGFDSSFFENGFYCTGCTELVRDVDFSVRLAARLETHTSRLRAQIGQFILSGYKTLGDGDEHESQQYQSQFDHLQMLKIESRDFQDDENIPDPENCASPSESTSSALIPEHRVSYRTRSLKSNFTKTSSKGRKPLSGVSSHGLPAGETRSLGKKKRKNNSDNVKNNVPIRSNTRRDTNVSYQESDVDDRNNESMAGSDEDFVPDIVASPSSPPPTKRFKIMELLRSRIPNNANEAQLQQNPKSESVSITSNETKYVGKKFTTVTLHDVDNLSEDQFLTRMKSETHFYKRSHEDLEHLLKKFVQKCYPVTFLADGPSSTRNQHQVTSKTEGPSQTQDQVTIMADAPWSSQTHDHLSSKTLGPSSSHTQDQVTIVADGPSTSHDQLSIMADGPSTSHDQLSIMADGLSTSHDQLSIMADGPSTSQDQATISADEPSMALDQETLLVYLLRREIEEHHNASKTYICTFPNCQGRFSRLELLRAHKAKVHKESLDTNPFECFLCTKRYATSTMLDVHYRRIHENDETPAHCEACPQKFSKVGQLVRHFKIHHKGTQSTLTGHPTFQSYRDKVAMCTTTYVNRPNKRAQEAKAPRNIYCPTPGCNFRSSSQQNLNFHHLEVHENVSHPFPCSNCGKSFKRRNAFDSHKCNSYKNGKSQCEHCGRTFPTKRRLTEHARQVHAEEAKFKCSVCHRFYFHVKDVEAHEKHHTQGTAYNCVIPHCPEPRHDTLEELRTHMTGPFHDSRKHRYVCEQCGYVAKGIKAAALMKRHMRTHTGEEPLKCHFCDKRFKGYQLRTCHEQIHHPDLVQKKTYACKECDATFTVAQYLYKHNAWHKYGSNACRPIAKKRY